MSRASTFFYLAFIFAVSLNLFPEGFAEGSAANPRTGTVTQVEGTVKIFSHPSKKVDGPSPRVLFEKLYYTVLDAKVGDLLANNHILRTAPGSRARIVFENGDQYHVAPGTAFRPEDSQKQSVLKVDYGHLRGVISKTGPRQRLMIKTRTATMGIRGTDFFISDRGLTGGTEVSVIRGAVEVKAQTPKSKPVLVEKGYSANIASQASQEFTNKDHTVTPEVYDAVQEEGTPDAPIAKNEGIELRKTTQTELVVIQRAVIIKEELKNTEVAALEKKAVETTLKDIQTSDPELFEKISKESNATVQSVNAGSIKEVFKTAPAAPGKPRAESLERLNDEIGTDIYEKYFKL